MDGEMFWSLTRGMLGDLVPNTASMEYTVTNRSLDIGGLLPASLRFKYTMLSFEGQNKLTACAPLWLANPIAFSGL